MADQLNRQFLENFAAQEAQGIAKLATAGKLIGAIQLAEKLGESIEAISEAVRNKHLHISVESSSMFDDLSS